MHFIRHDDHAITTGRASRVVRFLAALACAGLLSVSLGAVGGGDYNLNPLYCQSHTAFDPLWWIYRCWLPDPPGDPMT